MRLSELKLITNSRRAAEKRAEILQQDHLEHMRLNYPERIQKRQGVADGLTAALAICRDSGRACGVAVGNIGKMGNSVYYASLDTAIQTT